MAKTFDTDREREREGERERGGEGKKERKRLKRQKLNQIRSRPTTIETGRQTDRQLFSKLLDFNVLLGQPHRTASAPTNRQW